MTEWKAIETAPKDGTAILVWDADIPWYTTAHWSSKWNCWIDDSEWGRVHEPVEKEDLVGDKCYDATHWMPLPEPPKMETNQ